MAQFVCHWHSLMLVVSYFSFSNRDVHFLSFLLVCAKQLLERHLLQSRLNGLLPVMQGHLDVKCVRCKHISYYSVNFLKSVKVDCNCQFEPSFSVSDIVRRFESGWKSNSPIDRRPRLEMGMALITIFAGQL